VSVDKDEDEMRELSQNLAAVEGADSLQTSAETLPPDDVCQIVITESDSVSEKMMKEFALRLSSRLQVADDIESGYWSATCTPAPSRLSSCAHLPLVTSDSSCAAAASSSCPVVVPPSRLPSYGRLALITEAAINAEDDDDTQNQDTQDTDTDLT